MITREQFIEAVGHEPQDDDLERCNCSLRGIGHDYCGWDVKHNMPVFMVPALQMRLQTRADDILANHMDKVVANNPFLQAALTAKE